MKNVIIVTESDGENKELLAIENANKTIIMEVIKALIAINLRIKHNQAINNADIDVTRNLGLIGIKKYQRYTSQIQEKVDQLY